MIKAIIFDMNGVIINDEHFHNESWVLFCKKHGFTLSKEEFHAEVMGKRDKDTLEYLFKKPLTSEEINLYGNERDDIVKELVIGKLQLTSGLLKLLDEIRQNTIPLAIATSSRKNYVNFIVDTFSIRKYFQYIVTAEDIVKGKPNPEVYLKIATLLNVKPDDCLVFEDSLAGINAAKSAGMKVIGITTSHTSEELNKADTTITDFTHISLDKTKMLGISVK